MYRIGKSEDDLCRFCSSSKESMSHVFLECTKVDRNFIQYECVKNNLVYELKQIVTNETLKHVIEKFLQKYFGQKD